MGRHHYTRTSYFICTICDMVIPLSRISGQDRKKGHIKDIYCPKCKTVQKCKEYNHREFYKTLSGELIN